MNLFNLYLKYKDEIREKYKYLIYEYLEELKKDKELKVVVTSTLYNNTRFINNIELQKVIDQEACIYKVKRQDKVESLDAAETLQKFILAANPKK